MAHDSAPEWRARHDHRDSRDSHACGRKTWHCSAAVNRAGASLPAVNNGVCCGVQRCRPLNSTTKTGETTHTPSFEMRRTPALDPRATRLSRRQLSPLCTHPNGPSAYTAFRALKHNRTCTQLGSLLALSHAPARTCEKDVSKRGQLPCSFHVCTLCKSHAALMRCCRHAVQSSPLQRHTHTLAAVARAARLRALCAATCCLRLRGAQHTGENSAVQVTVLKRACDTVHLTALRQECATGRRAPEAAKVWPRRRLRAPEGSLGPRRQ